VICDGHDISSAAVFRLSFPTLAERWNSQKVQFQIGVTYHSIR
jgi:hypothetical protein